MLLLFVAHLAKTTGTIDARIAREVGSDRRRMTTVETGWTDMPSRTMKYWKGILKFSLVQLTLETGRLHQIRVHLQRIGHPVAGDAVYGGEQRALNDADTAALKHALAQLKRQALHARVLGFEHPATGENLTFSAPMPKDMQCLVDALRKK